MLKDIIRCSRSPPTFPWQTSQAQLAPLPFRTWERGAGLTRACGSAACAAQPCAASRHRLTGRRLLLTLPGGPIDIEWGEDDHIRSMMGSVALAYDGTLDGLETR